MQVFPSKYVSYVLPKLNYVCVLSICISFYFNVVYVLILFSATILLCRAGKRAQKVKEATVGNIVDVGIKQSGLGEPRFETNFESERIPSARQSSNCSDSS